MKHTQLPMWVNPDCRSVWLVIRGRSTIAGPERTLAIPWRGELFSFSSIKTGRVGSTGAVVIRPRRTRWHLTVSR